MRITEIRVTRGTLKRTYVRKQGRPVHKGDWGDALPRGKEKKKLLMYKRNILVSRVNNMYI